MFLPRLRSDMTSDRARALVAFAKVRGQAMLQLDYSGSMVRRRDRHHRRAAPGAGGADGIVDRRLIALMVAIAPTAKNQVRGLVRIAAAPAFTRKLVARLPPIALDGLARDGRVVLPAEPDPPKLMSRAVTDSEASSLMEVADRGGAPAPAAAWAAERYSVVEDVARNWQAGDE